MEIQRWPKYRIGVSCQQSTAVGCIPWASHVCRSLMLNIHMDRLSFEPNGCLYNECSYNGFSCNGSPCDDNWTSLSPLLVAFENSLDWVSLDAASRWMYRRGCRLRHRVALAPRPALVWGDKLCSGRSEKRRRVRWRVDTIKTSKKIPWNLPTVNKNLGKFNRGN